jgi:hypothetical protein
MAGNESALGGTAANDAAVGTVAWTNPSNSTGAPNGSSANATASSPPEATQYLKITGFVYSGIPADAPILGVIARITKGGADASDNSIKLVQAGTPTGSDRAAVGDWPGVLTEIEVGADDDDWGLGLVGSDIDSGFGIAISATLDAVMATANVDSVELEVFWGDVEEGAETMSMRSCLAISQP